MSALAVLPLLACALVILVARRSAAVGAGAGLMVALALIGWQDGFTLSSEGVVAALLDTIILTLSAAMVILPGLYFNALLRGRGIVDTIQQWVERLPYSREHKTLLLLFGLVPAVESLTGFGVSLFLSIPILFHLFSAPAAYRLSMLGMNIMPWGTLALATVVGATLSGLPVATLGWYSALTSALVFPLLSLVALQVIGGAAAVRSSLPAALSLSFGLSGVLLLFNWLQLTEIAGVLSGMVVCLVGALLLPKYIEVTEPQEHRRALRAFLPYGAVLLLIVLERFVPGAYALLSEAWVLSGSEVSLKVLTSPGMALLVVAVLLFLSRPIALPHKTLLTRAWTACLSLFAFIALAQVMRQSGMVDAFASALGQWNGELLMLFSPLIGMASGFITGSNLSGNALMMAVQSGIGAHLGSAASFAAAQNSGAGHAVFTSIPIIVLVLTIAKDVTSQEEGEEPIKEHHLLKYGLRVALVLLPAMTLATWVVYRFAG
ncbi:L-lactate permease [Pseudomonas sp. 18175]|uniref:L-lactate permease n=1 Tax=Pseudomonas sp. 18175 TaxID=3390056 RepID=UPI003D1FF089